MSIAGDYPLSIQVRRTILVALFSEKIARKNVSTINLRLHCLKNELLILCLVSKAASHMR